MSDTKYTAGPWSVHDSEYSVNPGIDSVTGKSIIIYGAEGEHSLGVRGRTDEEKMANAHLIAAAPEMLEALEGMVWLLEKQSSIYVVLPQFEKMVAAIKKAKGE